MRSGAEIKVALESFVDRWRSYGGSERAEAQTFLNELFACYGTNRAEAGARFEAFASSAGFMDLFWPENLIVEMKAPGVPLAKAEAQRERYWKESSNSEQGVRAARYVITCNFSQFEVWEPGAFPKEPRAAFSIDELPERYDALLFLQAPTLEPVFVEHRRALTTDAAEHMASLYTSLIDRDAAPLEEIQNFTMQAVWCLFAEDLGMLEGYPFQRTVEALLRSPDPQSARDLGFLFRVLNQKSTRNRKGLLAGTRYVNGSLFAQPAEIDLNSEELQHLHEACAFDWRAVDPTIFGSLMEGVLGEERRSEFGAHYTHEADILKIVTPTIVRPWRKRIEATMTPQEARDLLDELCAFTVLDPACGCGNFLYVAYREMRDLESALKRRMVTLAEEKGLPVPSGPLPYYPLSGLHGMDILPVAVLIARITLWMGHRQMIETHGPAEDPLPLVELSNIRRADALRTAWPTTDVIVGNPPFIGDRMIRGKLGDDYLDWLKKTFKVGVIDLSGYWFRRAAEQMEPGQRAGLVSTNTLRENKHRRGSLDYVVQRGGVITDAVSSQKWPGDAKVHVSITNWVMAPENPPTEYTLDGASVSGITSQLREGAAGWEPHRLAANKGRSFIGCQPTGDGFLLGADEAQKLLQDPRNAGRVRPYLTSRDLANSVDSVPTRWIIDFGTMPLEEAAQSPDLLDIVRQRVRPEREGSKRHFARLWWQFAWPRPDMRAATADLDRYIVCTLTGKRFFTAWQTGQTCPSNAVGVIASEDDLIMGVLSSRAHDAWAWWWSSTMKSDLRYTPTSTFQTFPFPTAATSQARDRVAEASRELHERRSAICRERDIGLTALYNLYDDGAFEDLHDRHRALDEAVASAYGWPAAVAQDGDELVARLNALNEAVVTGEVTYAPWSS